MNNLPPCPLCGSTDIVLGFYGENVDHYVVCGTCRKAGKDDFYSEADAVAWWVKRCDDREYHELLNERDELHFENHVLTRKVKDCVTLLQQAALWDENHAEEIKAFLIRKSLLKPSATITA